MNLQTNCESHRLERLTSSDRSEVETLFAGDLVRFNLPYSWLVRFGLRGGPQMLALRDLSAVDLRKATLVGVVTFDESGRSAVFGGTATHARTVTEEAGRHPDLKFIDAERPVAEAIADLLPPLAEEDLVVMARRRHMAAPPPRLSGAIVREAGPDDAGALAAHYSTSELFGAATVAEIQDRLVQGFRFALAETPDDGVVSAAWSWSIIPGLGRISGVYTQPRYGGKGLAGAVVGHLCEGNDAAGAVSVLYREAANPVSGRLYEKLGFEPVLEVRKLRYRP